MEAALNMLIKTREAILRATEGLSTEQLNAFPEGFNNNIAWNVGHVIVTQQLLTYRLAGLPLKVSKERVALFMKGSSPVAWTKPIEAAELEDICTGLALATMDDFKSGLFADISGEKSAFPYSTSFGAELTGVEDAVQFNNIHEGLHYGTIKAYRQLLG